MAQAAPSGIPPSAGREADNPLVHKAKDLLHLAETDRRAAEEAFEQLGYETQFETALALQGDELQDWLLLAADCTELVRALPPEHLHHAIRLIGEEDALTLLQTASSAQMQALMDIEWFSEGKLDRRKVRKWIELLMALHEDEADEAMQGLDANALALFLKRYVKPTVSREQLLLNLHMNQHYLFTPADLETADDLIERFLNFLYAVDRDLFGEVLELMVAEEQEIVEADAYGLREDRLRKRGFPVIAEAEHLLQPIDLRGYNIGWPKEEAAATGTAIQSLSPSAPFLLSVLAWGRAKGELNDRTERSFIKEAAELSNALLIAHAKDPGEPHVKRDALAAVQVLGGVGLEACSRGNAVAASEALKAMELRELFQIGWTLTREVASGAWALAGDPRLDRLGLGGNLDWLAPHLRHGVLEAELMMSWREIARTFVEPSAQETPAPDDEAEGGGQLDEAQLERMIEEAGKPRAQRKRELLTWPRLCHLKRLVEDAKAELDRRLSARSERSAP